MQLEIFSPSLKAVRDNGFAAATCKVDGGNTLYFFAYANASAAKNAFGRVARDGRAGGVDPVVIHFAGIAAFTNTKSFGQFLQFAIPDCVCSRGNRRDDLQEAVQQWSCVPSALAANAL